MVIHDCTTLCALRAIHGPLRFLLRPEPFFVGLPRSAAPSRTQVFTNVPHLLRCFPFSCHPSQQSSSRRCFFFFMESLSPHRRMLIIYILHIHGTNTSQHKEHVCDTRRGLWWKQHTRYTLHAFIFWTVVELVELLASLRNHHFCRSGCLAYFFKFCSSG